VGLYGVIAYVVNLRTREIGIRIALGLTPTRATGMIVEQGAIIVAAGAITGLLLFVAFARLLKSLTFQLHVVDATAVLEALCVVTLVAIVATWIPARRAARIDPSEALRSD
jgi:putative ABC transport system permease protein